MPVDRATALAAYQQVANATAAMKRALDRRTLDAGKARQLVSEGALTDQLPVADWRETLQDNNLALLEAFLDGADLMSTTDQWERLHLAVCHGSAQAVRLMIDRGYGALLGNKQMGARSLRDAISGGEVEKVEILLQAGADLEFQEGETYAPRGALSFVRHAHMLDFLLGKGFMPTNAHLIQTAIRTDHGGPNPHLLQAFLDAGTPTEADSGGWAWMALVNDQERMAKYPEQTLECARLLLAGGAARKPAMRYGLGALVMALEAGLPPEEAEPTLTGLWNQAIFSKSELPLPGMGASVSSSEQTRQFALLLERAWELGARIDLLETLGRATGGEVGRAFALAGVDTGQEYQMKDEEQSMAQAARLRRTSPPARHASSPRRI